MFYTLCVEYGLLRKHVEPNYYMTQFVTVHVCYRKQLCRFVLDIIPFCSSFSDVKEDPEHVLFNCLRFKAEMCENCSENKKTKTK